MVGTHVLRIAIRLIAGLVWAVVVILLMRLSSTEVLKEEEDRSISLLVWPLMIDAEKLIPFERETGIKVYVNYYETPRELLYKMRISQGKGYDMMVAADHVMPALIKEGLLKPIDVRRLSFFNNINRYIKGRYFDPDNKFSIPYILSVYGLGIDREYFGYNQQSFSWRSLFEPDGHYRVSMTDVSMAAVMLAGVYLFGSTRDVNSEERIEQIEQLLIAQKEWVQLYTDIRGEDMLATKNCPVVMTIASDLWRIKQEYTHLDFVIPQEGSGMVIESFAVSKQASAEKVTACLKLLEYLYRPEVLYYHSSKYGFIPPLPSVDVSNLHLFIPTEQEFQRLSFLVGGISKERVDQAWLKVMTS